MPLLSEDAFKATMRGATRRIDKRMSLPDDFWPYFDSIGPADLGGFSFGSGTIHVAYRDAADRYHHVLLASEDDPDVFLAIVVESGSRRIHGHHLLDLPELYGLRDSP